MKAKQGFCLSLFFFLFTSPLLSDKTKIFQKILITSSLKGNLDSCTCKIVPESGLVKWKTFLSKYKSSESDSILLDNGNLFENSNEPKKNQTIREIISTLPYDAIFPGTESIQFKDFIDSKKFILSGLICKAGIFTQKIRFPDEITLNRKNHTWKIYGYYKDNNFPQDCSGSLNLNHILNEAREKDFHIILSNLSKEEASSIIEETSKWILIIGKMNLKNQKPEIVKLKNRVWYINDEEVTGNFLEISVDDAFIPFLKKIKVDYDRESDDPEIRKWIDSMNKK